MSINLENDSTQNAHIVKSNKSMKYFAFEKTENPNAKRIFERKPYDTERRKRSE